jgi:hypothetical protein
MAGQREKHAFFEALIDKTGQHHCQPDANWQRAR